MSNVPIFFAVPTGDCDPIMHFVCDACDKHRFVVKEERCAKEARPDHDFDTTIHPCPKCGQPARLWSYGATTILKRFDNGEELPNPVPPGAVWAAEHPYRLGPDGRDLYCMLPNGHPWHIDGFANNCDMPEDKEHFCWLRTGRPEDGTLHVSKEAPGFTTCGAGAGSILSGDYHGFLKNGVLESC